MLRFPGVCVVPATGWQSGWGLGRVDLAALLAAPLPALGDLRRPGAFGDDVDDAANRIANAIDADPVLVRTQLGALLQETDPAKLQELLDRHEGELVYLAYTDPDFVESVTRLATRVPSHPRSTPPASADRSGAGSAANAGPAGSAHQLLLPPPPPPPPENPPPENELPPPKPVPLLPEDGTGVAAVVRLLVRNPVLKDEML